MAQTGTSDSQPLATGSLKTKGAWDGQRLGEIGSLQVIKVNMKRQEKLTPVARKKFVLFQR